MKILVIGLDIAPPSYLFGDERLENLRRLMEYGCFGRLRNRGTRDKTSPWLSLLTGLPLDMQDFEVVQPQSFPDLPDRIREMMVWREVERQGGRSILIEAPVYTGPLSDASEIYASSEKRFIYIQNRLNSDEWEYFQFIDDGLERLYHMVSSGRVDPAVLSEYLVYLDGQIGAIFELLNDETEVLVVSPAGMPSVEAGDGAFILASSNNPLSGEIGEVDLSELAPTLLELAGYDIPDTMERPSLAAGKAMDLLASGDLSADEEAILRERLSGLGYIS